MVTLYEVLKQAETEGVAVGHFNVSDLVTLKAVFESASDQNVPVIVGVSEGERQFLGVRQASKPIPCPSRAGRPADRRHRDESVELARCRYSAWRRAPAVEEARCRRDRSAKATASMARGGRESRTQDRTHCSLLRGWPGWFLVCALVEATKH